MKKLLNNKTIISWLIIVLLIANLSAVTTVYFKVKNEKSDVMHIKQRNNFNPRSPHLHHQLNFSKQQYEIFEQLRKEHINEIQNLDLQMQQLRLKIGKELAKQKPDSINLNKLAKEFGSLQTEIKQKTFNHFTDIKHICNKEQKQKFNSHIINVVESQKPGPGRQHRQGYSKKRKFNH